MIDNTLHLEGIINHINKNETCKTKKFRNKSIHIISFADNGQFQLPKKVYERPLAEEESETFIKSHDFEEDFDEASVHTLYRNNYLQNVETPSLESTPHIEKRTYRIWILVVLALFIRYLNLVTEKYATIIEINLSGLHINKIFVPFILYEVGEFAFLSPDLRSSNLGNILLLLNIQPRRVEWIVFAVNVIFKFSQDLLVYFFTFTVSDLLITFLFGR